MHLKTTNPQCFVPRLPQRLVRRYAVQSVQVAQTEAAGDQRAQEAANHTSHGAADTGCAAQQVLWRLIAAALGLFAAAFAGAAGRRRWRWRRWGFVFISIWHDSIS
jgi:hypothetical protein